MKIQTYSIAITYFPILNIRTTYSKQDTFLIEKKYFVIQKILSPFRAVLRDEGVKKLQEIFNSIESDKL